MKFKVIATKEECNLLGLPNLSNKQVQGISTYPSGYIEFIYKGKSYDIPPKLLKKL